MPPKPTDDWAESRWMPPSPHKEAVLERIARGRAHIESQGHGKPPLLVHEDGGILELHRVRVGSWDLEAAGTEEAPEGITKHVDVCGTVDEIERWLKDEPAGADGDPERLERLLAHALHMCRRMERRWRVYREFAVRVAAVCAEMEAVVGPDCTHLDQEAARVRTHAHAAGHSADDCGKAVAHAEAIRDVANSLEGTLRRYRDAATQLAALYEDIRGARNWATDVEQRLAALRGPGEAETDAGEGTGQGP